MSEMHFPMQPLSELTIAIKDGTHGTHRRVAEGVPLLSAKNITATGDIALDETDDLISEAEYQDLTRSFRLEADDLLLTIVGSLGRRAIYSGQRVTFQRSVAYVRPKQQKLLSRFLFHWMGHPAFSAELARRSNATAQAGLYLGELARVSVPVPERPEQKEIAQILDTLDTTIFETKAIIAKLKAVKQALLHDLLTRGIDANGELRPPQAEAPHLYKESPLGWIPKGWEIESIARACSDVVDCPHSTPHFQDQGVLVARTMHIKDGIFLDSLASRISERQYRERIARLEPQPGDLIFTREAPVGEAFVVPLGMKICLGQRVMLLRPKNGRLIAEYLLAQIYSGAVKDRIASLTSGTTNPHLNVSEVKEFEIPLPPFVEQQGIADRLRGLESRLHSEMRGQKKLELLKSGLMDDLLTGRVRVTPLLEGAAS